MAKADRSNTLSPFQRFEKLAEALFAIPKKEVEPKTRRVARKRRARKRSA
jgi:hypothetical protein